MAGLTPLLLGSPPISHEYYDPAEFMEGGPQEADRMDELEYEVSRAARPGQGPPPASGASPPLAGCSPAQAWLLLSPGGRVPWPLPTRSSLLRLTGRTGSSRAASGRAWVRSLVSLCW